MDSWEKLYGYCVSYYTLSLYVFVRWVYLLIGFLFSALQTGDYHLFQDNMLVDEDVIGDLEEEMEELVDEEGQAVEAVDEETKEDKKRAKRLWKETKEIFSDVSRFCSLCIYAVSHFCPWPIPLLKFQSTPINRQSQLMDIFCWGLPSWNC